MNIIEVFKNCLPMNEGVITEENPLVLYSIVRKSLGMSPGKIAGQCQHAMQYLMEKWELLDGDDMNTMEVNLEYSLWGRIYNWKESETHTKIILEASDNEWEKLKLEYDPIIVIDAGKTEIAAGSETVAILYPMFRDERSKTLKRCQLLK